MEGARSTGSRTSGRFCKALRPAGSSSSMSDPIPGLSISGDPNNLTTAAKDMLSGLQQANIAVYAFDAAGLQTFAALASDGKIDEAASRLANARQSQDELKILA